MEIVLNFDTEEIKELELAAGIAIDSKERLCEAVRMAIEKYKETYQ